MLPFISIYGTLEYLWPPESQPNQRIPPPLWTLPRQTAAPAVLAKEQARKTIINQEASQPPLYYTVAGLWWRLGKALGLDGGALLYWLRFLNVPVMAALVWLVYLAARAIFPSNVFPRLAAPALLAFMPQSAFYSIQNDVFSPLTFGIAFLLLTRWLQAETPGARLSLFTGLALAAAFLTKISNLPLLAVSALAIGWKIRRLHRAGNLRAAVPAISCLVICAGLPMALWMAWCRINFGDFTGSLAKIKFLGWTHQPFAEWWRHPIFTPHGLWTFLCDRANAQGQVTETGNLATFWQGEMLWQGRWRFMAWICFTRFYHWACWFWRWPGYGAASPPPARRNGRPCGWPSFASPPLSRFSVSFPSFTISTIASIRRTSIPISLRAD